MYFSGEIIFFISLLLGLMFGWLVGTMVRRTGFGLVGDIAAGIIAAFIGCWLTLASRHAVPPENIMQACPQAMNPSYCHSHSFAHFLSQSSIARARKSAMRSLRRRAATICLRISLFGCCIGKAVSNPTSSARPGRWASRNSCRRPPPIEVSIIRSIHCKRYRRRRACCAICPRGSGILASLPLPTTRDRSVSRIGSLIRASFRRKRRTTSRPSPAGLRRRGPSPKPAARR